jgi:chemotaxis protein CheX
MPTKSLEPRLTEDLRKSAREVLESMVFLAPTSVEPLERTDATFADEVIGLLSFTGTRSGSFVVRATEALATKMAANMLMTEPEELGDFDEVADAFGEIVNMLSGSFKNAWVAEGNQMDLSVPHVVRNGRVNTKSDCDSLRTGIRVQLDDAFVDVGVYFEA